MLVDSPSNPITSQIIAAAIDIHKAIGPGLLESAYAACLRLELGARGLRFAEQRVIPLTYKGTVLDCSYRVDLIVEDVVIVEIKSIEHLAPVHRAQLLTYLRLSGCQAGLLINFNVPRLVDGIQRVLAK